MFSEPDECRFFMQVRSWWVSWVRLYTEMSEVHCAVLLTEWNVVSLRPSLYCQEQGLKLPFLPFRSSTRTQMTKFCLLSYVFQGIVYFYFFIILFFFLVGCMCKIGESCIWAMDLYWKTLYFVCKSQTTNKTSFF